MQFQEHRAKLCGGKCFPQFSLGGKDAVVALSLPYLYLQQLYDPRTVNTPYTASLYLSHQTQPIMPVSICLAALEVSCFVIGLVCWA